MNEPIKIAVTADTSQAAQTLGSFVQQQTAGLKLLAEQAGAAFEHLQQLIQVAESANQAFDSASERLSRQALKTRLKALQSDPFLTNQEKNQQSIPLYQQALAGNQDAIGGLQSQRADSNDQQEQLELTAKINDLLARRVELQHQLAAAQGQDSFGYQFSAMVTQLQNIGTLAQQAAGVFKSVWQDATNTISTNITKLIEGTERWGQALRNIGASILNELISGIVRMFTEWIMQTIILGALKRALGIQDQQQASQAGASWGAAAVAASIASYGAAAAIGTTAAIAGMGAGAAAGAALSAFAEGGRPTPGELALVGERGPELWVPDTSGTVIPAHVTAALMQGGRQGAGAISGNPASGNYVQVNTFLDPDAMRQHMERSDAHEKYVVDVMRRNISKFR